MRRIQHSLLFLLTITLIGCEEPMDYKYADKPFSVNCSSSDKALLREALYSFQEDIAHYFKDPDVRSGSNSAYIQGYNNFIFRGLEGSLSYQDIASPYTMAVLEKLRETDGLWDFNRNGTNLNYTGDFMNCVFSNISDQDVRDHFQSLLKVNHLTPEIMAEPMRQRLQQILEDQHLALYLALDGYYQNLLNLPTHE
ncbi:MAG: hypothetical protein KTR22_00835 [Flavobacteriaceae bacterium]|nr:hypothetical protein [Flavobacteriaceae bacterium]